MDLEKIKGFCRNTKIPRVAQQPNTKPAALGAPPPVKQPHLAEV